MERMADGIRVDPGQLALVWGKDLPNAANLYDAAIERMARVAPAYNRVQQEHVLESVESSWRTAIDNTGCVTDMLRGMQNTLLLTADAIKAAMQGYAAADEAAALRLGTAQVRAVRPFPDPH